jgi:hypothetical protein
MKTLSKLGSLTVQSIYVQTWGIEHAFPQNLFSNLVLQVLLEC